MLKMHLLFDLVMKYTVYAKILRLCTLTGRRISVCKVTTHVSEVPPAVYILSPPQKEIRSS